MRRREGNVRESQPELGSVGFCVTVCREKIGNCELRQPLGPAYK